MTSMGDSRDGYFALPSRKRSRPHSSHAHRTPNTARGSTAASRSTRPEQTSDRADTPNNINVRYQLAGGYDTPGLIAAEAAAREEEGAEQQGEMAGHEEQDYRRRVRDDHYSNDNEEHSSNSFVPLSGPLARERNGIARLLSSPNGSPSDNPGWTRFAFSLVGKVFNFGTSMVKGFYAGGGEGYEFSGEIGDDSSPSDHHQQPQQQRWRPPRHMYEGSSTPVPGSWRYEEDEGSDGEEEDDYGFNNAGLNSSSHFLSPQPQPKRRQTDRDSWVIVGDSTPSTPSAVPAWGASEASPRRKHTNSRTRPSASRASARRSLAPLPRRQSGYTSYNSTNINNNSNFSDQTSVFSHTTTSGPPLYQPPLASPTRPPSHLPRRASVAATRSPHSSPNNHHRPSLSAGNSHLHTTTSGSLSSKANGSPHRPSTATGTTPDRSCLSPEAKTFMRRQARADRAAEKAISGMSKRLEEMIAQGKAALGTRVAVDRAGEGGFDDEDGDDDDDEGGFEIGGEIGGGFEDGGTRGWGDDEGFVDYEDGKTEGRW